MNELNKLFAEIMFEMAYFPFPNINISHNKKQVLGNVINLLIFIIHMKELIGFLIFPAYSDIIRLDQALFHRYRTASILLSPQVSYFSLKLKDQRMLQWQLLVAKENF